MYLEQNVPVLIVTAVLIKTIPPEPITTLGNVQRFPSGFKTWVVWILFLEGDELLSCLYQPLPREGFLFLTSPCTECSIDPRPCSNGLNLWQRRFRFKEFRRRSCDNCGVGCQTTVPLRHEGASVVLVLEFGHEHPILAIECNSEEMLRWVFARIEKLLPDIIEICDKI